MSSAAVAAMILVLVVVFISARESDPPAVDVAAVADADERMEAMVAPPMDASAPCAIRSETRPVPDTVTLCREKNLRNFSMAAANSRLATLSEQPTRLAAVRWLLFWK